MERQCCIDMNIERWATSCLSCRDIAVYHRPTTKPKSLRLFFRAKHPLKPLPHPKYRYTFCKEKTAGVAVTDKGVSQDNVGMAEHLMRW
eukprot:scaffold118249_cov22-Prasinocladus_malaysianus.AAC.1